MVTKLLTTINDREIIDGQIATFIDVSGAADRYLVESTVSGDVNIQDFDGGVIVLQAGVTLDSVQVAAGGSAVQLVVNGSTITYTSGGAGAAFSVVLGGSNENTAAGQTVTAEAFADLFTAAGAGAVVGADGALGDGSVAPGPSDGLELTTDRDVLTGTAGDDVFTAPVVQNQTGSGQLANTFETGDVLNGGEGYNQLNATLISSGAIGLGGFEGPSISATTSNIHQVNVRAQNVNAIDFASNPTTGSSIDAELMVGVEQWWSDNSRANLIIEDIRTRPVDTTFGMKLTDPLVSFLNYFNPLFLDGDVSRESALTLQIAELNGGIVDEALELTNITVREVNFTLGSQAVELDTPEIRAANTWAELAAALGDAMADAGLSEITVAHIGQGRFIFDDPEGREFQIVAGEALILGTANNIDVRNQVEVGAILEEGPTQTNIILDGAGNGSQGGTLDIGVMSGLRGVEIFDIEVNRDSHLARIESTNAREGNIYLEEVNITNAAGATGDLQVGLRTIEAGVSTTTDDRLDATDPDDAGFQNVRSLDASGFQGELKIAATIGEGSPVGDLTDDIFDRYLDNAEGVVTFDYLLGDGGSNLSLFVNNLVSSDLDFALNIDGGAQDDRINLENLTTKIRTTIDGEGGFNTVELSQSTGTSASNAFGGFTNIDKLVVAGSGSVQNIVDGNMTAIDGGQVVIATDAGASTSVAQLRSDTEVVVSGKNQTIGAGNGNNDQDFGAVGVNFSRGIPGQTTVELTLENTARLDGEMDIQNLQVSTTGTAAINVLDLKTTGIRETSHLVRDSSYVGINTINLLGTQDLAINVSAMPAGPSIVNGAELTGDLTLGMNSPLLNGTNNIITGTAGADDLFAVYNNNGAVTSATVSGFETVQLGLSAGQYGFSVGNRLFSGEYNAANTTGAELFHIQATNTGPVSITNLDGDVNVLVSTLQNTGINADINLSAAAADVNNTINIELDAGVTGYTGAWANGDRELTVVDYRTVNLELDTGDAEFGLMLNDGTDATYTRTLNISGGDALHSSLALAPNTASLDIGQLDTALTRVDISAYDGELVGAQWDSQLGSNAVVVGNEFNFNFDLLDNTDFGQSVVLLGGQLGLDGNYGSQAEVQLDFDVLGTAVSSGPFAVAINLGDKDASLAQLAADITAAPVTAFAIGLDLYEIDYTAVLSGGNLTVSTVITDVTNPGSPVVLGEDEASIVSGSLNTDFSADAVDGGVTVDQTDVISNFITTFDYNTDAEAAGVVWEIADFNAFGVDGVSLSNVSIIDLAGLGVTGLADIVVQDGADYLAGLNAGELAAYNAYGNNPVDFQAGDAVITSNGDLDFTIHLTGVDFLDLSNENFVFAV